MPPAKENIRTGKDEVLRGTINRSQQVLDFLKTKVSFPKEESKACSIQSSCGKHYKIRKGLSALKPDLEPDFLLPLENRDLNQRIILENIELPFLELTEMADFQRVGGGSNTRPKGPGLVVSADAPTS